MIEKELVANITANTGHHATETGLQKHSIGNAYPLHIVGYGYSPTIYTIENMKTGEVLSCLDDQPRGFRTVQTAADVLDAMMLRKHMQTPVRWFKGRPVRHKSNQYLLFKV
jgi:hypothetical protein